MVLGNSRPVYGLLQLLLQDVIEPDSGGPPISIQERMGNIHLHILVQNLLKGALGHLFYFSERLV